MSYDNSGSGSTREPDGWSLLFNAADGAGSTRVDRLGGSYFAEGINGWSGARLTVRELAMLRLTESITDKSDWDRKVFDDAIVVKWKTEAMAMPLISEKAFDWVIREVREKAEGFKESKVVLALDSNARCAKSDVLVGKELRDELIAGVKPLLEVGEEERDYHPGSNRQVLNLVHPSLYPLVHGRTRVMFQGGNVELDNVLASCGKGETVRESKRDFSDSPGWSRKFQWLPCEVEFTGKGTDVRITSYINNLHPDKHRGLYRTIEKIVGLSVPLWNEVVMYDYGSRTLLRIVTNTAEWAPSLPEWAQYSNMPTSTTDEDFEELLGKINEYLWLPDRPGFALSEEDEYDEDDRMDIDQDPEAVVAALRERLAEIESRPADRRNEWDLKSTLSGVVEQKWKRFRHVAHPEPGESCTYEEWKAGNHRPLEPQEIRDPNFVVSSSNWWPKEVSLQEWYKDRGLQVIVKLASIELTPDNARYPGGSWHLEGMKNEHIVATSIYYYDVENTTSSHLSFRQGAMLDDMDLVYEQDDHQPLATVFGTESMRDEPAIQVLGHISTPEGRLLAFPNTLQHKVEPFELEDKSKPGHRRFLVMWLVDPHYRVVSTRKVPPQQHSWWAEKALRSIDFGSLPQEVVDMVKDEVGEWPMGLEEAKKLRLELMAERTRATENVESVFEEYNLCEH